MSCSYSRLLSSRRCNSWTCSQPLPAFIQSVVACLTTAQNNFMSCLVNFARVQECSDDAHNQNFKAARRRAQFADALQIQPKIILSHIPAFQLAFEINAIDINASMWIFQCFMKIPAWAVFIGRTCLKSSRQSLQERKLISYCYLVNYLLNI